MRAEKDSGVYLITDQGSRIPNQQPFIRNSLIRKFANSMLYLDGPRVHELLKMENCIRVMRELFRLPKEEIDNPLRSLMMLPDRRGLLGMMPAHIPAWGVMGIKVLTVFPKNYLKGLSSHIGIVHLFSDQDGQLLLSVDADAVTAIRTAAVSAVMTECLSCEDSSVLALLGSGVQAHTHLEAICCVRKIKQVRVWSPNPESVKKFIKEASRQHDLEFLACATPEHAVEQADIICAATAASDPFLHLKGIQPHAHINAIGACTARQRELHAEVVRAAEVYVDDHVGASHEAGDILLALEEGEMYADVVRGDIHQVLTHPPAGARDRLTLFKSVGVAIEDLAVARHLHGRVRAD
jgi:ornithine cyclodeaminase/alanine dehydrogenase-like protein (mu-crystallin family)